MMSAEKTAPNLPSGTDCHPSSDSLSSPGAEPAAVADAGKIRLGGAFRLPAAVADTGKIRLGGAFRLPNRRTAA